MVLKRLYILDKLHESWYAPLREKKVCREYIRLSASLSSYYSDRNTPQHLVQSLCILCKSHLFHYVEGKTKNLNQLGFESENLALNPIGSDRPGGGSAVSKLPKRSDHPTKRVGRPGPVGGARAALESRRAATARDRFARTSQAVGLRLIAGIARTGAAVETSSLRSSLLGRVSG